MNEYQIDDNIFVRMQHSNNHLRKSEPATTNTGYSSIVEKGSSAEPTSVPSTSSSAPSAVPNNALSTSSPSLSNTENPGWASVPETGESLSSIAPSPAPSHRKPGPGSRTESPGRASVSTILSTESPSYGKSSSLLSDSPLIVPSYGPSGPPSHNPTSSTKPSTLSFPSPKRVGNETDLAALDSDPEENRDYADFFDEEGGDGNSEGPMTTFSTSQNKTRDKEKRTAEPPAFKSSTGHTRVKPGDWANGAAETSQPRWGGRTRGSNGMSYGRRGKGGKGGRSKSSNSKSKKSKSSKSKRSKSKESVDSTQSPDLCEDFDYRGRYDVWLDRLDGSDKKICDPSVIEAGDDLDSISIFLELVEIAGWTEILATCIGPFTLAAPRDEAWELIGSEVVDALKRPENSEILDDLIRYHIIPGFIPTPPGKVVSLSGHSLVVSEDKSMFNDATVIDEADACNGELFLLDLFLVPPEQTPSPAPASGSPSPSPSNVPSLYEMTRAPTPQPTTVAPTMMPTTLAPTNAPTFAPTTAVPTMAPTTDAPTMAPSTAPSPSPTTNAPVTEAPTASRFDAPVCLASEIPTVDPPRPDNRVLVRDFYMSYYAQYATREPSDIEYKEIRTAFRQHLEIFLRDYFSKIPGVSLEAVRTVLYYGTDQVSVPQPYFNLYMEYSGSEVVFTRDTDPALIPTEAELFNLFQTSITPNYILNSVRVFDTSPFYSTTEVHLQPVDCEALQ